MRFLQFRTHLNRGIITSLCAGAISFALIACSPSEPDCLGLTADFDQIFADQYVAPFRAGDAQSWAEIFVPDAMALHNRRDADIGQDAIRAFGQLVADTFILARYDVSLDETRRYCDWAVSRGNYQSEFVFRQTGEAAPWGPQTGKFLIVWTLTDSGAWRILADMGNSNQ